jgi:hypothetical protein
MQPPRRHGLAEYIVVMALLAVAAAGAVAFFREPIRAFFGTPSCRSSPQAPSR